MASSFSVPDRSHAVSLTFSLLNNRGLQKRKAFTAAQRQNFAIVRGWTCGSCHAKELHLTNNWEIDHKVGLAEGGTNDVANLQLLCSNCHANKTRLETMVRAASRSNSRRSNQKKGTPEELRREHRDLMHRMKEAQDTLDQLIRQSHDLLRRALACSPDSAQSRLRALPEVEEAFASALRSIYTVTPSSQPPVLLCTILVSLMPALPEQLQQHVTMHTLPDLLRRAGVVLASNAGPAHNLSIRRADPPMAAFDQVVETFRMHKRRK
jgi:hypothetical protein